MQIFLVIAKRGLTVDMIYVATGRLGDGVAGGGSHSIVGAKRG